MISISIPTAGNQHPELGSAGNPPTIPKMICFVAVVSWMVPSFYSEGAVAFHFVCYAMYVCVSCFRRFRRSRRGLPMRLKRRDVPKFHRSHKWHWSAGCFCWNGIHGFKWCSNWPARRWGNLGNLGNLGWIVLECPGKSVPDGLDTLRKHIFTQGPRPGLWISVDMDSRHGQAPEKREPPNLVVDHQFPYGTCNIAGYTRCSDTIGGS